MDSSNPRGYEVQGTWKNLFVDSSDPKVIVSAGISYLPSASISGFTYDKIAASSLTKSAFATVGSFLGIIMVSR